MTFYAYDTILDRFESAKDTERLQEAKDFLRGFDFSECEIKEEAIKYCQYIETYQDVEMYYDYGADYYFFCPSFKTLCKHGLYKYNV